MGVADLEDKELEVFKAYCEVKALCPYDEKDSESTALHSFYKNISEVELAGLERVRDICEENRMMAPTTLALEFDIEEEDILSAMENLLDFEEYQGFRDQKLGTYAKLSENVKEIIRKTNCLKGTPYERNCLAFYLHGIILAGGDGNAKCLASELELEAIQQLKMSEQAMKDLNIESIYRQEAKKTLTKFPQHKF